MSFDGYMQIVFGTLVPAIIAIVLEYIFNDKKKKKYIIYTIVIWSLVAVIASFIYFFSKDNQSSNSKSDSENEEVLSKYHQGTITETGWESNFIGLRYTNPEGMSMSTEEELYEMNKLEDGTPSIIYSEDELGYIRLTTVFEMMSKADDNSITVGVCVERLIDETDEIDISQYIKEFESQTNQNPFYNYKLISDDEIVKIGNYDYIMVSYIEEFNNVFRYQDSYFRVVGDRVIMIIFNFNDERARDNVLNAFTAY